MRRGKLLNPDDNCSFNSDRLLVVADYREKLFQDSKQINDLEKELLELKKQYRCAMHDYEETMVERKIVLEENTRLTEERDKLKEEVQKLTEQINELKAGGMKYQRRDKRSDEKNDAIDTGEDAKKLPFLKKNDEFIEAVNISNNSRLHAWRIHKISFTLQHMENLELGIVLGGGKDDTSLGSKLPIFVRHVVPGCQFDKHLKTLDFLQLVNDIDVSWMDQRSVIDILKYSRNLNVVVKRRNAGIHVEDIALRNLSGNDIEVENGVYISKLSCENDLYKNSRLCAGCQLIHIDHVPVIDAEQADHLIKGNNKASIVIGFTSLCPQVLQNNNARATAIISPREKQKFRFLDKVHDRFFGRTNAEKTPEVIARANLDACTSALLSCRHGSLRIPSNGSKQNSKALVRTASLRAASAGSELKKLNNDQHSNIVNNHSLSSGENAYTKIVDNFNMEHNKRANEEYVQFKRKCSSTALAEECPSKNLTGIDKIRPSNSWNSSPYTLRAVTTRSFPSPSTAMSVAHTQRYNQGSPLLPHPPPYPGRRLNVDPFNIGSTSTCQVLPSPSTAYRCHSPSCFADKNLLQRAENSGDVRYVTITRNELDSFGLTLENRNGGVIIASVNHMLQGRINIGEQLLDVCGINMRSADKHTAIRVLNQLRATHGEITMLIRYNKECVRLHCARRANIRLCGGNLVGILIENSTDNIRLGERVLKIDGKDVSNATLEEAVNELRRRNCEMIELTTEYDGGHRLECLRRGCDGDGFYIRVHMNRAGKNSDELDIKRGDILYVDSTLFMGTFGRWRAWRVDPEGRQRQCGIILSLKEIQKEIRNLSEPGDEYQKCSTAPYERVERVASSECRPIVFLTAYISPFVDALIEEHSDKFVECTTMDRAPKSPKQEMLMKDAKQRYECAEGEQYASIFDVARQSIRRGYHCILNVTPQEIHVLRRIHLYPIVIKIKYKSAKQVKELAEECGNERISSKEARELLERFEETETMMEKIECTTSTISISSSHHGRKAVRYVCQQILAIVEHEQKRTVWLPVAHKDLD